MARRGGDLVSILECDPDLGEDLSTEQFELARAAVLAPACSYPRGRWSVGVDGFDSVANLGLLIIKGFLVREVTVAEYTCAELLGPGDVVQPWLRIGPDHSVAADVGWMVAQSLDVGVLVGRF